jgi:hypothetical protein
MKRILRRPSPAMVVAIVALIAALGGTAIAGGFITKKKAKKIAANQVNKLAPGLSVKHADTSGSADSAKHADSATAADSAKKADNLLAAKVSSTGTLQFASEDGISVQPHTGGSAVYGVLFPRDISNCAITTGAQAGGREIAAFQSASNNRVGVLTFNSAGAGADFGFSLMLVC